LTWFSRILGAQEDIPISGTVEVFDETPVPRGDGVALLGSEDLEMPDIECLAVSAEMTCVENTGIETPPGAGVNSKHALSDMDMQDPLPSVVESVQPLETEDTHVPSFEDVGMVDQSLAPSAKIVS